MNSLHRKIAVCLLILVFCFNLFEATASVIDPCESRPCCCCTGTPMYRHGPSLTDDSVKHKCCSSPQNVPCHLNKNRAPEVQAFIVSSTMEDLQKIDGGTAIVVGETSVLQPFIKHTTKTQFWVATDPIPIYLQNLTFIC